MRYCRKIHQMNTDSLTKQTGLKTHVKNTVMFELRANGAKSSGKRMRTMEFGHSAGVPNACWSSWAMLSFYSWRIFSLPSKEALATLYCMAQSQSVPVQAV